MVLLVAQFKTTVGALVTVKDAEQVTGDSQEEVTVQVTVFDPPHAKGAPELLLEMLVLHPPEKLTVVSHVAYAASMAACV